ncbi:DUF2156 domain-containing protein [Nocardia sp. CDC159]|uniref:DUF2156 domain-containing protein n=1 Tax=Nocardia pulmonis TaxID=2951408 RepID=A0A9X2EAF9_9NOCA|nr:MULTISPECIES: DUF2156 domain-containing protein [Nocardia]MCM6777122.1 DUF2156 domain-containing protein [Nocardia pulmonis]MCM6790007.1 DUF2156 domain-containing protein [Nocardia sp. CDC159]
MVSSDVTPRWTDARIDVLQRYADNPSAFLALNHDNAVFTAGDHSGFICYRTWGRYLIQFGGPFAAPERRAELLRRFLGHAADARKRVVAVQLPHADAALYADLGMPVNQIGASYAVALDQTELAGKRFVRLRNKISRAQRAGLVIEQVDAARHRAALAEIDQRWLRAKGPRAKPLRLLVGEIGGPAQRLRRLFLATIGGRPVGYVSYSPVYGAHRGWLHDLSRRVPEAVPGVMEAVNFNAMRAFRREGAAWLHFGFTPFTGLDPALELPTASRITARAIRLLADHGDRVYPSRSQLEYKLKWQPALVFPEYLAVDRRLTPAAVWSLLRATNAL